MKCWSTELLSKYKSRSSFKLLFLLLLPLLLTVTVLPVFVIWLFELLVFWSWSLFVFCKVCVAVWLFVICGLFVFVVSIVTFVNGDASAVVFMKTGLRKKNNPAPRPEDVDILII